MYGLSQDLGNLGLNKKKNDFDENLNTLNSNNLVFQDNDNSQTQNNMEFEDDSEDSQDDDNVDDDDYEFEDEPSNSNSQMDNSQSQNNNAYGYLANNNNPYNSLFNSQQQDPSFANSRLNFEEPDEINESLNINLPPHACTYCGNHDLLTVVQCKHMNCGKWFCNGNGKTSSSHIVTHLVKSKHREIALHPESPFGDTILECYNCGCKNIFLLGFITAKTESVVILLCREPCATSPTNVGTWDIANWKPLISGSDRSFLPWLVKVPSSQDQERARQITLKQILKLEDFWKSDPTASIEDVEKPGNDETPNPTLLTYVDAYQYQDTLLPLITLESLHEKQLRESLSMDGISVVWEQGLNRRWAATFNFSRADSEFKIIAGDELKILCKEIDWEETGRVTKIENECDIFLQVPKIPPQLTDSPTHLKYRVEMVWRSTSFERMSAALKSFAMKKQSLSSYLYHALLGHDLQPPPQNVELPQSYSLNNLPILNQSQIEAANNVLRSPLSLIQGPPGTGKTVISAFIVNQFVKKIQQREKVLVCTPSNVAIDQLTGQLHRIGLKVVRLCSKLREEFDSPVEYLTLHHQTYKLDKAGNSELSKLQRLKQETSHLDDKDERRYLHLKRGIEQEILRKADVICTTCVGAGDPRLSAFKFPYVLIDEATQACEPECLIPLVMGAKQVVLVGDHCQLGPVLFSRKVIEAGLSNTLFERLIRLGHHPQRLKTQYRMHQSLSEFPSNTLYDGQLVSGLSVDDRSDSTKFPWPQPKHPMFFYNCTGSEEISSSGTSFVNILEASTCEKIVTKFLELGAKPSQIGIITPYEGQRAFITTNMTKTGKLSADLYREIEVASVDSFQGREKDYIILSCVRSNDYQGIGFLQDPRRLNVALTRARYGLIILGNARVLSKNQLWNNLINHFKSKKVLVEGSLANLKESNIQLEKPKKLFGQGRLPIPGQNSSNTPSLNPSNIGFYDGYNNVDPNYGQSMIYGSSQRFSQNINTYPGNMGGKYPIAPISSQQYSQQYNNSQQYYNSSQQGRQGGNGNNNQNNRYYDNSQPTSNGFSQQSQPSSQASSQNGDYHLSIPMSQSFNSSLNSQDSYKK
ncbi:helicase [Tieghemostelium lacteum]|uniref:Helicase n=1 Tax=Tieghemostelium lacteum TaxID=361077 RepID=A0A151ZAS5_TIELA|nr:helicase [Tieghemostelium lacteum]|eukprot:KYQ91047.1 helicase [Tieghemostelium lacteum]